jgi:hypothetical protein
LKNKKCNCVPNVTIAGDYSHEKSCPLYRKKRGIPKKSFQLISDYMDIVKLRNQLHAICKKYDPKRINETLPEEADILMQLGKMHVSISTVEKSD